MLSFEDDTPSRRPSDCRYPFHAGRAHVTRHTLRKPRHPWETRISSPLGEGGGGVRPSR